MDSSPHFVAKLAKACAAINSRFDAYECLCVGQQSRVKNLHATEAYKSSMHYSVLPSVIGNGYLSRSSFIGNDFQVTLDKLKDISISRIDRAEISVHPFSQDNRIEKLDFVSHDRDEIEAKTDLLLENVKKRLNKEWKGYEVSIFSECKYEDVAYINSYGLKSDYERSQVGLHFSISSLQDRTVKRGYLENCLDVEDFIQRIERSINTYQDPSKKQSEIYIKGGKSSVVLSPTVVEMLSKIVMSHVKMGSQWPPSISKALPKNFILKEKPIPAFKPAAIPFDHEGVLTSEKVLCEGSKKKTAALTDMRTAGLAGNVISTGNGFRRGLFSKEVGDNAPSIHPSSLFLEPGNESLESVMLDHEELILINSLYLPTDRIMSLVNGQPMIVIRGDYYKEGQFVSHVFSQNYARRPLISCYPEVYGSLLDPKAIILNEGESLGTGWYPYIYLPVLTWAN